MSKAKPAETIDAEPLPVIPDAAARMILESHARQSLAAQQTQALVGAVIATLGLDPVTHGVRVEDGALRIVRVEA